MRLPPAHWAGRKGCLKGHPAFILGNGPWLPQDLSSLDALFTVGVNRILLQYDPTVLIWLDEKVTQAIRPLLADSRALLFARDEICEDSWNCLYPSGLGQTPDTYVNCHNSGVSAACWAISLGCEPVYLLGMSARYRGGQTNFYGSNRAHVPSTLPRLGRAVEGLLRREGVYAIADQQALSEVAGPLAPLAKGRQWYVERLTGLHLGQLAAPAR